MDCGSEVGVGLFTGHRTLVLFAPVEVCAHYGDMAGTIAAIDWRMAWEARSEVAKGVHSALISAKTLGEGTTVVFVTDGHEAPPLTPTLLPQYRGRVGDVRGAIAGIGGEKLVPIPKLDAEGRRRGFWKRTDVLQVDPASMGRAGSSVSGESFADVDQRELQKRIAAGQEHLSSLKESYLQELSSGLALEYRRIDDGGDMLALLQHSDLALQKPARLRTTPSARGDGANSHSCRLLGQPLAKPPLTCATETLNNSIAEIFSVSLGRL